MRTFIQVKSPASCFVISFRRRNEDIHIVVIVSQTDLRKIVARGSIRIGRDLRRVLIIAFDGVAHEIAEGRGDLIPLFDRARDVYGKFLPRGNNTRFALIGADILYELQIVIIAVAAFHRFDIAGKFFVERIHEETLCGRECWARGNARSDGNVLEKFDGDPLVPARYEYRGRRFFERVVPLLLKIRAFVDLRRVVFAFGRIAASQLAL